MTCVVSRASQQFCERVLAVNPAETNGKEWEEGGAGIGASGDVTDVGFREKGIRPFRRLARRSRKVLSSGQAIGEFAGH